LRIEYRGSNDETRSRSSLSSILHPPSSTFSCPLSSILHLQFFGGG